MYECAFDRIRAECVCEVGFALEQMQVSSNAGPCMRSNVKGTFDRIRAGVCV
jgi:hypothetical protein